MEKEILGLLSELCPDFGKYKFLKSDLYKGSLFGGWNVYYKKGKDGKVGMVTRIKNEKKYHLDRFPKNFESVAQFDGSLEETGWTGENLLNLLKYLKARYPQR